MLQKLKEWREITAKQEEIVCFRVLHNKVLEDIARLRPRTKESLLAIKGIREKKFEKYGQDILALVNARQKGPGSFVGAVPEKISEQPFSVSKYLNVLNEQLCQQKVRVQGEISSLDIRGTYLFFSLKDREDQSVLHCFMWHSSYRLCGVSFEVGMEIIVEGFPEVYKPNGRLSFKVSGAELVGEGALKKAYDQLKNKLEAEGLFLPERKKPLPEFPQKIGLITSETGVVIHDFLTNLGRYGYQIKFADSKVEGQSAVRDLLSAINYFCGKDIDVLVIIRGGGSFESLQAFNNEVLVRKIADFNIPIICGIGHERDVPLASSAADLMVSAPTAAAVALNQSWDKALSRLKIFEQNMIDKYQKVLDSKQYQLEILNLQLRKKADFIFEKFKTIRHQLYNKLEMVGYLLKDAEKTLARFKDLLLTNCQQKINWLIDYLDKAEKRLNIADPRRQLKLGYSIASLGNQIIRSVKQVKTGDQFDVLVFDGKIKSQVNQINNK